jgi:hypothetical protein
MAKLESLMDNEYEIPEFRGHAGAGPGMHVVDIMEQVPMSSHLSSFHP